MMYLAMDIGGTFVKYAQFDPSGRMISVPQSMPIDESAPRERVLETLINLLRANPADAVGICAPGPFDYESGTSLMQHKYAAIFGVSLRKVFEEIFPGVKFRFLHDVSAFLLGEMAEGNALNFRNVAGITLGTGLGFTVARNGLLMLNERHMPLKPLWNLPYRNGIAEDFVSRRAIRSRYLAGGGQDIDVREIAQHADQGEPLARTVLEETGSMLIELISMRMDMGFDCVVIGGQIARAFGHLFPQRPTLRIPILPAKYIDSAALRGICSFLRSSD